MNVNFSAKCSFYRATKCNISKSWLNEEVTLHLFYRKCMPILEVRPLYRSDISFLDFAVDRIFTKLFETSDTKTMVECWVHFRFKVTREIIFKRAEKFHNKEKVSLVTCNIVSFIVAAFLYAAVQR